MRQLTKTELEAYTRRKAFHLNIEVQAAQLKEKAAAPAVAVPNAITPEAMPAETDPPAPAAELLLDEPRRLMVREVQQAVAAAFNLTVAHLKGPRRTASFVIARQVAMMLCKELCWANSLPAIGREFGGKDHTTVLHACRVAPYKIVSAGVEREVDAVREALRHASMRPLPDQLMPKIEPRAVREGRVFPTVRSVQNLVAQHYYVNADELRGRSRDRNVKDARKVAYYLASEVCGLSVPVVALHFDGRHHATAYEGREEVQFRMLRDIEFCKEVAGLLAVLKGEAE